MIRLQIFVCREFRTTAWAWAGSVFRNFAQNRTLRANFSTGAKQSSFLCMTNKSLTMASRVSWRNVLIWCKLLFCQSLPCCFGFDVVLLIKLGTRVALTDVEEFDYNLERCFETNLWNMKLCTPLSFLCFLSLEQPGRGK